MSEHEKKDYDWLDDPFTDKPQKESGQGMGSGSKMFIGCGCLVVVIAIAVIAFILVTGLVNIEF